MSNINFGIDLGTTNSAIARYENGKITLYKNPVGFKDTLPSVVSFRKGRIQIGDKARELMLTQSENVFASFKRKMGTDSTFTVPDWEKPLTPVDLSSMVLKELVNFTQPEQPKAAVITIPASFDTIQTNATKKAGYLAGFDEVVLLQEPIAACLAYSNSQSIDLTAMQHWLVYDFGGGTFDVALVRIDHRELKVVDHKGNNFLGGVDLDNLLVEKIICPKIEQATGQTQLWRRMLSGDEADCKKLYFELLFKAEEAKKELSIKTQTAIELDIAVWDAFLDIDLSRVELESVLRDKFEESYQLTEGLLGDNALAFSAINRIILVGGTTYIPYIREQLGLRSGIPVDTSVDPTTAVVIGAAYYAGAKPLERKEVTTVPNTTPQNEPAVEIVFEPHSKDAEELIAVLIQSPFQGFYRLTRADGGFDTGVLRASSKITEFVPLLEKATNQFTLYLLDEQQNIVYQNTSIAITNGLYNVMGQPLPNDICLEVDEEAGKTFMERIFKKNDILPLKKTVYKTTSKNILKNSDEKLIINIVEGNAGGMIGSNLSIGYIEITGKNLPMDLIKGMDIELHFKISESRDLSVSVYIGALDLEINEIFNPHQRHVALDKVALEINGVIQEIEAEMNDSEDEENYTYLAQLKRIKDHLIVLHQEALEGSFDQSTDRKYQLDEMKRLTIQAYDDLVRHKHVLQEIEEYQNTREAVENYLEVATPKQKEEFEKIIRNEKEVLQSNNKYMIRQKTKALDDLYDSIYMKQDQRYYNAFYYYRFLDENEYTDSQKFMKLVALGETAIERENIPELKAICYQLWDLLRVKPKSRDEWENFDGDLGLK
ncbi:Hsp70 family protein [Flavobacterium sp.]|uniref:Hsp70 family protein n=1 Tax=Flavobacterium sp. TaxID=239 RepID=UPI0022BB4591|nr:Hsp70 family protein [Flavobacterium sp.]MCZ8144522.1 Hsp70 family protein [Flavobacterium sp.]MCZ8365900.1 Hsp70 family protein [Flavobacterium sp.]